MAFLAIFSAAAVAPLDRGDWALENLLLFVAAPVLAVAYRQLVLSNLSYALIFVFLVLHTIGAHYTYALTPVGFWVQDALQLGRNHYDRFVHFSFGLLLSYPLRELTLRILHLRGASSYLAPVLVVLALSAVYEILEHWAARVVDPELGIAFLGTQGDEWDAQKDMALAMFGAAIAMAVVALYRSRRGREPWSIGRPSG